MKKVCATDHTVRGIDLSHWDADPEWDILKASGIGFVFAKATDGSTGVDGKFEKFRAAAKAVGIPFGAYHFFRASQDPIAQAKHFCSTVGPLQKGDLLPMIDWELDDGTDVSDDTEAGLKFIAAVKTLLKVPKLITYGGASFLEGLGGVEDLADDPLFVAHYGVQCPDVPEPWDNWVFWQFSDSYPIPGIGKCDADLFNGTIDQLKAYQV